MGVDGFDWVICRHCDKKWFTQAQLRSHVNNQKRCKEKEKRWRATQKSPEMKPTGTSKDKRWTTIQKRRRNGTSDEVPAEGRGNVALKLTS